MYILACGRVGISRVTMSGRSILVEEIAERGDIFGEVMADYMGVTRPSLSRELGKMQAEGLIRLDGRRIVVTDQDGLERYL